MDNYVKAIANISCTGDGIEFLSYLRELSLTNYEAFKKDDRNEFHKGYAVAIDSLIKVFETATEKKDDKAIINSWS